MGRGIVNSEVLTELPNKLFSFLCRVGLNIHSQELAGSNICHLRVASLQYEIVVDRLSFRIPSQGLVLYDDFYGEA